MPPTTVPSDQELDIIPGRQTDWKRGLVMEEVAKLSQDGFLLNLLTEDKAWQLLPSTSGPLRTYWLNKFKA